MADRPANAKYLIGVLDADDVVSETDESNNETNVRIASVLYFTDARWNRGAPGVSFKYSVAGASLPSDVTIGLFWGDDQGNRIGSDIETFLPETAVGDGYEGESFLPFSSPDYVPLAGATTLLVVADPENLMEEEHPDFKSLRVPHIGLLLESVSPGSFWRSLDDGAGFLFTYTVTNPDHAFIPNTSIDFTWETGDEAYFLPIETESDKSSGDHKKTIAYADILRDSEAPDPPGGTNSILEVQVDPDGLLSSDASP